MLSSSGMNTFDKTSDITHWLLVMLAATAKLHHILTKQLKFTAVLSITIPQPQARTTNHYHLLFQFAHTLNKKFQWVSTDLTVALHYDFCNRPVISTNNLHIYILSCCITWISVPGPFIFPRHEHFSDIWQFSGTTCQYPKLPTAWHCSHITHVTAAVGGDRKLWWATII
jgi:hypothetical protein